MENTKENIMELKMLVSHYTLFINFTTFKTYHVKMNIHLIMFSLTRGLFIWAEVITPC